MHVPPAPLPERSKVLVPPKHGGVLSRTVVADYPIAKGVAPGVFVTASTSLPSV